MIEQETSSLANPLRNLENSILIEAALKELSPQLRDVIILHYFQELKLSEVAEALNLGLPLVKYRLKSAKKKLEQLIGAYP